MADQDRPGPFDLVATDEHPPAVATAAPFLRVLAGDAPPLPPRQAGTVQPVGHVAAEVESDGDTVRVCGAGREFIVLTSDRCVMPCSFHHQKLPASTAGDVMDIWRNHQGLLAAPSRIPGCARAPGFGLGRLQVTQ